jgi:hypothetical protein
MNKNGLLSNFDGIKPFRLLPSFIPATYREEGSFWPLPFLSPPRLCELLEAVEIIEPLDMTLFERFLSSCI